MKPGRKPAPTEQKRRRGNPGKRALNLTEPAIGLSQPTLEPPADIADNAAACTEWRRLTQALSVAGVLGDVDRSALIALCQQWAIYLRATEDVKRHTLIIVSRSGYPMPNPYLGIANRALTNCIKLWAEFGCTPSSRSRVSTNGWLIDPIEAALADDDDDEEEDDDSPYGTH